EHTHRPDGLPPARDPLGLPPLPRGSTLAGPARPRPGALGPEPLVALLRVRGRLPPARRGTGAGTPPARHHHGAPAGPGRGRRRCPGGRTRALPRAVLGRPPVSWLQSAGGTGGFLRHGSPLVAGPWLLQLALS